MKRALRAVHVLAATAVFLLAYAVFIAPSPARAQPNAIPHIYSAIKFATEKGWCEIKGPAKADCNEFTTFCRNDKWAEYVKDNFELSGPLVTLKQGHTPPPDGVISYLRDRPLNQNQLPLLRTSACYCECAEGDTSQGCSGKAAGTPVLIGVAGSAQGVTREECDAACAPRKTASKCAGALPYLIQTAGGSAPSVAQTGAAAQISLNMTCFRPDECSTQDGVFETYAECPSGKGRCYAKEPIITLNTKIGNVSQVQGMANYVITAYRYLISVIAVISTVMFIFGAFLYLVGSAMPKIEQGKKYMIDAVVGMLLVIGAVTILRTINPNTLTLNPLKVYMVNTIQFIQTQFCKDIAGSGKFALAGEDRLQVPAYQTIAANPANFNTPGDKTECGKFYYLENNPIADACEGNVCPKGELCQSCADGEAIECRGQRSAKFVCSKAVFAGSITYMDFRRPTEAYLIFFCNYAQNNDVAAIEGSMKVPFQNRFEAVGLQGNEVTDTRKTGFRNYSFALTENVVKDAESFCSTKGGLRGAMLAMKYYDRGLTPSKPILDPTGDDYLLVVKQQCVRGSAKQGPGYSDGRTATDFTQIAEAISCANQQGNLVDDPKKPLKFWSADELRAAINGDAPITCDFMMSDANAPSDPVAAGLCKGKASG